MKKKIVLVSVIAVAILSIFFFYRYSSDIDRIIKRMPKTTTDLKIIYNGKGQYECEYSYPSYPNEIYSEDDFLNKVYVKNKMVKEVTYQKIDNPTNNISYEVRKDGYYYPWFSETDIYGFNSIIKQAIKPEEDYFNINYWDNASPSQINYQCTWAVIPDSIFDLPIDREVVDEPTLVIPPDLTELAPLPILR